MKEVWCYIACYKVLRPVRFHSIDREDVYSVALRITRTWKTDAAIPNETMRIAKKKNKRNYQLRNGGRTMHRPYTVHVETSLIEHAALPACAC